MRRSGSRPADRAERPKSVVEVIETADVPRVTTGDRSPRLLYVARGRLTAETRRARWLVRRDRAMWVPADVHPQLTFEPSTTVIAVGPLPTTRRAIGPAVVSALLRAAVTKLAVLSARAPRDSKAERHLLAVIADELAHLPDEPTLVPMPADPRLRALAARLQEVAGLRLTLAACGRETGMSARTLSRLLHQQTGLSFGRWRRRLHLAAAMSRLSSGDSVNSVAYAIGYDSPSAFITMFRRALGMTPAQYADRMKAGAARTAGTHAG